MGEGLGFWLVSQPQDNQAPSFSVNGQPNNLYETGSFPAIQPSRLQVGASDDLFTDDAVALVFQHSQGRPRKINKICIQSILKGGHKKIRPIDAELVRAVLKEIDQE